MDGICKMKKTLLFLSAATVIFLSAGCNFIKASVGEAVDAYSEHTARTIFYFDIPSEKPYEKDTGWLIKTNKGGISEVPIAGLTEEKMQKFLDMGFSRKAAVSCQFAVLYCRNGKMIWPPEYYLKRDKVGGDIFYAERWTPEWKVFSSVMYEEICLVSPEKGDDIIVAAADPVNREIRYFSQKLSELPDFKGKHIHRYGFGFIQTCILDKGAFARGLSHKVIKIPSWNKLAPINPENGKFFYEKFFGDD